MKATTLNVLRQSANPQLWLATCLAITLQINAQTTLTTGHTDVGIVYEDDAWNLHVGRHEDSPPAEYGPNEAILQVGPASKTSIPANPAFGFLGEPGAPIFVLPEVQNPALLFLGLGTEELASGLFTNDQVQLHLKSVTGPGQFFVYEVSAFGTPTVFMNSRDGIASNDVVTLTAGGHRHVNWAFSTPGTYQVDFEASGTLASNAQFTASGPVTYNFKVLGESPTLGILRIANGAQLDWQSALDVNYQIQSRQSIGTGAWTNWGEPTPGTGAPLSIPVTQSSSNEFFRVILE
jgi:surface-anchored protein